jgi:hypothetical protein
MAVYTITAANSRFNANDYAFYENLKMNGPDTLNIMEGGYLLALNGNAAALLDPNGPWTVNIHGSVFAEDSHAIIIQSSGGTKSTSKITIGATGQVASEGGFAIAAFSSANVINAGVLLSDSSTVVGLNGDKGAASLTNTGTIGSEGQFASISSFTSADNITVTNSGTMYGRVDLYTGNDVVTNNAYIHGDIYLEDGNNRFTQTKSSAEVYNVTAGTGNNVVSNAGTTKAINLGDGKNSITITKSGYSDSLTTGSGDDTVSISGWIKEIVVTGAGKDSVTVGATGTIYNTNDQAYALVLGTENDTFSNAGKIYGGVNAGGGDNTGSNKGWIEGNVLFSTGTDKFSNSGTILGDVMLGDGINFFTNSGTIEGTVTGGVNADTFTNSKNFYSQVNVDLGDGADVLNNSGVIQGSIKLGAGADKVVNTGSLFTVDLGTGDDIYIGGNGLDYVRDGDGLDNIKLGGSIDFYVGTGATAGKDGLDVIDAGTGADYYYGYDSTSDLHVNLDTVQHDIDALLNTGDQPGNEITAANTVTGVVGTPDTGIDKIYGFEHFISGDGHDRIWGSGVANTLSGAAGNDALIGLAGNDTLYGGTGGDTLVGGAGRDDLWGNAPDVPAENTHDQFVFLSISDSGTTKATRDIIWDFEDGKDKINLSVIDANTTKASPGLDHFDYINDNGGPGQTPQHAAFTGVAGQLRSYWTATGQIIEADVNGDKKADFSIELYDPDHNIVLTQAADFILN